MEVQGNIPNPRISNSKSLPTGIRTNSIGSKRSVGESTSRFDKALLKTLWQLIDNSIDSFKRIDKIKDVLEKDDIGEEEANDVIVGIISDSNSKDLSWSTNFLKQFNRVCKYEKEMYDMQRTNLEDKSIDKQSSTLAYTRMLEPLVRYVVQRNKPAVQQAESREPSKSPTNAKEVRFDMPVTETMQKKSHHMISVLAKKAKEMRDEEEKDSRVGIKGTGNKGRQTALDQLFAQQEKLVLDQEKRLSELEATVAQYKDLLTTSSKLAGMVCFKMADLANTALKNGYYYGADRAGTDREHGVHNEETWANGFFQSYEKLCTKDRQANFVAEKSSRNFKPLAKLLTVILKKKDEHMKAAAKKETATFAEFGCQVEIEPKVVYIPYEPPSEKEQVVEAMQEDRGCQVSQRSVQAKEAQTSQRSIRDTLAQTDPDQAKSSQRGQTEPDVKPEIADGQVQTSQRSTKSQQAQTSHRAIQQHDGQAQTSQRSIKEQQAQTDPSQKPATRNFSIQSFMAGAVAERAQQTDSTCFGAQSKKVQTNDPIAPTGKQRTASTQTRNWRDVPYAERRELVTKMYGTVAKDRIIKTAEHAGASPGTVYSRFDMPEPEDTVPFVVSRQYQPGQAAAGRESKTSDGNSMATEQVTLPMVIHCENCGTQSQLRDRRVLDLGGSYRRLNQDSVGEAMHEETNYSDHVPRIQKKEFSVDPSAKTRISYRKGDSRGYKTCQSSQNSPESRRPRSGGASRSKSRASKSRSPMRRQYVNESEFHHDQKYDEFLLGVSLKNPKNLSSTKQMGAYQQQAMIQRNLLKGELPTGQAVVPPNVEAMSIGVRHASVPVAGRKHQLLSKEEKYVKALLQKQKRKRADGMFVAEAMLQDKFAYQALRGEDGQSLPGIKKNTMLDSKRSFRSSTDFGAHSGTERSSGRVQNYYTAYNNIYDSSGPAAQRKNKLRDTVNILIQHRLNDDGDITGLGDVYVQEAPKARPQRQKAKPRNFPLQGQIKGMLSSRKYGRRSSPQPAGAALSHAQLSVEQPSLAAESGNQKL